MNRFLCLLLLCFLFLASCIGAQPPAPVSYHGQSAGAGSSGIHTVVEGDTLWRISNNYRLSMRGIAQANNLRSPFALTVGQRIKLPPPNEYKARAGDSLYSISRLFGVSMSKLASMNYLQAPYTIRAGQALRLPSVYAKSYAKEQPATLQVSSTDGQVQSENLMRPPEKPSSGSRTKVQPKAPITTKTPKRSSGRFMKPVSGSVISRYGPKKGGLHNDGMNILAPKGTPVRAAENGVVVYAGNELKGSGNLVLVRHSDRWMSAYAHMDKVAIKRGDVIKRGQSIGTVGATGSVDKPQLHFELRRGTSAVNPQKYIEG